MTDALTQANGSQHIELARQAMTWDRFVESKPESGFMQTSWWADLMATRDWGHFGAIVRERDTILGGARVLTSEFESGRAFFYIPEGPALPDDEADGAQVFASVMDFIEHKRRQRAQVISHLRIEPRWLRLPAYVKGFRVCDEWMEPRNTLYIDLSPSEDQMLARMKPKGRYNVSLARRHGVEIVEDVSARGIEDFLSIYQETVQRQALRPMEDSYFPTLIPRLAESNRGSVFFAQYQGTRIATVLAVYFGDRATYFFGGSRALHREVMAPYLLHFHIMLKAKALGCQWYDMYGVAPPAEAEHKWSNISAFKRKLGGCDFSFVPTLDYVYDADAYENYRKLARERRAARARAAEQARSVRAGSDGAPPALN